ncbi:zinc ribbon domain-containing protein [Lacticaseibacillus hulanensis]|uniref:zinc ribbon domain-containing protein n=1 Tax=Lacticaseibacillus hulanensis TaxID=2493111 RepID=UPI000FDA05B0
MAYVYRPRCPNCGKYVKRDGTVCTHCGQQLGTPAPARRSSFSWFTSMSLTGKIIVIVVALVLIKIIFG